MTPKHTLPEHISLVLVVSILHLTLQLLSGFEHVLLHLLPLLLLHFIEGLPTFGVLKFKSAWTGKARGLLTLPK